VLRAKFSKYEEVEQQGRDSGVDSKPFLARYVAENLKKDKCDGWAKMNLFVCWAAVNIAARFPLSSIGAPLR
jgi:hypothetical protein